MAELLSDARRGLMPGYETTVIVDEAGMAANDQLAELVTYGNARGWRRLVCVGDAHQLPAVGRAGMFPTWCDTTDRCHSAQTLADGRLGTDADRAGSTDGRSVA